MRNSTKLFVVAMLGSMLGAADQARAGLLLDTKTVQVQQRFPNMNEGSDFASEVVTVGPGVEIPDFYEGYFSVDIFDKGFKLSFLRGPDAFNPTGEFNGTVLTDFNGSVDAFTGVTINSATNIVGLDSSRITFDKDNIFLNLRGLAFNTGTIVQLDIISTPEPSTLVSASIAGLVGVVYSLRHRRKAKIAA